MKLAFFGVVLLAIGGGLLYHNESTVAANQKELSRLRKKVVALTEPVCDSQNNGQYVFVQGRLEANQPVEDRDFHVRGDFLRLERQVSVYRWISETTNRKRPSTPKPARPSGGTSAEDRGGANPPKFEYKKAWVRTSPRIKDNEKRRINNRHPQVFDDQLWSAKTAKLGEFSIHSDVIQAMKSWVDVDLIRPINSDDVPEQHRRKLGASEALYSAPLGFSTPKLRFEVGRWPRRRPVHSKGDSLYISETSGLPKIGDHRIRYRAVPAGMISGVFRQQGDRLRAVLTPGDQRPLVVQGEKTVEELFSSMKTGGWVFRILSGILFVVGGLALISPFAQGRSRSVPRTRAGEFTVPIFF